MMKNKKRKYLFIILLVIAVLLFVGVSYAFVQFSIFGTKTYTITGGELSLVLDESANDLTIGQEGAYPVADYEGMEQDGYNFSIKNESIVALNYSIYIDNNEENTMNTDIIRYNYKNNVDNQNVKGNLKDLNNRLLDSGKINADQTISYNLKFWIGVDAVNDDVIGKIFSVKLRIVGEQVASNKYVDNTLNGADPILTDNLVPILISDDGIVTKANINEAWYSYSDKQWANAIVLVDNSLEYKNGDVIPEENIQSYFVWIPKYSYKLFNLGNYSALTTLTNAVQTIDVKFGLSNTDSNNSGECTTPMTSGATGTCKLGDYMTHPAFISMDANGLWVGKFETGYEGATSPTAAEINVTNVNKVIIKPNVYSWRTIQVANAFQTSYNYLRNEDSHMMKNTEWGAVAYLQHSAYGSSTSVRVNNNSNHLTGYAATIEPTTSYNGSSISGNQFGTSPSITQVYNSEVGVTASTTSNITGIYDMSGGTLEYLMAYTTAATSAGELSQITSIYEDFFSNDKWNKYYDKYLPTSDTNYNYRILGDATGEMGPFQATNDPDGSSRYKGSWYTDISHFVFSTSPWFVRGADYTHGSIAGIFSFGGATGSAVEWTSFRVALAPQE